VLSAGKCYITTRVGSASPIIRSAPSLVALVLLLFSPIRDVHTKLEKKKTKLYNSHHQIQKNNFDVHVQKKRKKEEAETLPGARSRVDLLCDHSLGDTLIVQHHHHHCLSVYIYMYHSLCIHILSFRFFLFFLWVPFSCFLIGRCSDRHNISFAGAQKRNGAQKVPSIVKIKGKKEKKKQKKDR
jgi:hypothetical protein